MAPVYTKLTLLGSGSYGSAWLVKEKDSTAKKVMKEVNLMNLSERNVKQALAEVVVLARCKHNNIIRYYEAFADRNSMILSILMDYASEGDLHQFISKRGGLYFPNEVVLKWFTQLLSALAYIHKRGILHRDIKPQNLFVDERHILKLGDFGICRILQSETDVAITMIGTPFYLSPEICLQKPYNSKSDMWSAGCVLYELCSLHVPFTAANLPSLTALITAGVYKPLPCHCDPSLCDAVKKLLMADPVERWSAGELLRSSAFQEFSKVKNEDQEHARTPNQTQEEKATEDSISNSRKRQAESPLRHEDSADRVGKGRQWEGSSKQVSSHKDIESTTYTVVRHPKLRHLSPASSPELSQLLERQRSISRVQLKDLDAQKAQSVDAPPPANRRKQKNSNPPRLNLQKFVIEMDLQAPENKSRKHRPKCGTRDFDEASHQQIIEAVSRFHNATSSFQKERAMADVKNTILMLLGPDELALVVAAIRGKTECSILVEQFHLGPFVLSSIFWYHTLQMLL